MSYEKYKQSGTKWLGDIPEHWEILRLKYSVDLINQKVNGSESDLPYTGLEHIESWTGKRNPIIEENSSEGQSSLYNIGDVLFGKLRPYLAKVHAADSDGICTGELLVLRPKAILQRFLCDYLLNPDFIYIVDSSTYGAKMPRANWDYIGNLPILVPPASEQKYIVEYLEREKAQIDILIEKKKIQIELLQEKRAALISHVVTKGVRPNVKMKDSGIMWLGMIPDHWEVKRAKVLFREVNCRSTTGEEELLTVSHITGITRRSEKNVNMFMAESLEDYKKCKHGDLVINTMWAWMGAMGFASESGIVSPSYNVYRFRGNESEPWYYDYLFRTGRFIAEVICFSKGVWSSRLRLYPEAFFEIRLPCPPYEEQCQIVDAIKRETGNYDELQRKIEMSIEKLLEYRTALISAAVTGKIDVRNEVK